MMPRSRCAKECVNHAARRTTLDPAPGFGPHRKNARGVMELSLIEGEGV